MSASQETITLSVAADHTVRYTYDGEVDQPTCDLAGAGAPGPDPSVDYVFQLDEASVANHWTMTGHRPGSDPFPLTFTPGPETPCTSYTVHHPGTQDEILSWSFQYTNSQSGDSFWSDDDEIRCWVDIPPNGGCVPGTS